jgi:putative ABC transport system substrate-binding protein
MRRRKFIALGLGGIVTAPLLARAERRVPVVGFLSAGFPEQELQDAFLRGLSETGFGAAGSVKIEYRYANGEYDRLQRLAAELKGLSVDVIVAVPSSPPALAAKAETSTIPIVFFTGVDPVRYGLVDTINRPGGNITGISTRTNELTAKRIELLHEIVSPEVPIAALFNSSNRTSVDDLKSGQEAARALGRDLVAVYASNRTEIEAAFATVREKRAALVVWQEGYLTSERQLIVALAERNSVICIYGTRLFTDIGGLISYGPNIPEMYRLVGIYTGKVLGGTRPSELPVMQPTTYELVINLKTARTLGLTIPATLIARATAVIE